MSDDLYSEFGKGFTYCIGLFLMHAERDFYKVNGIEDYSSWFNGAGDHLFELQIPKNIPEIFKEKIQEWRKEVLKFRCNPASKLDFEKSINTAKEILIEYDKFCDIDVCKGTWE
jgi:hypothetical protein